MARKHDSPARVGPAIGGPGYILDGEAEAKGIGVVKLLREFGSDFVLPVKSKEKGRVGLNNLHIMENATTIPP